MATGIVLSIDPSGTTGQVQVDETGETLPFNDPNFPNTGLTATAPTNACTFDILEEPVSPTSLSVILYYATNMQIAPVVNNVSISGSSGAITANVGDIYTISSAAAIVTGAVTINGGKVIVDQNATINGAVTIGADGILVARGKGKVNGAIIVNTGGSMKVVNNGHVAGTVVASQAGRMIIGNDNGPGSITGTITIQKIRSFIVTAGSTITGQ